MNWIMQFSSYFLTSSVRIIKATTDWYGAKIKEKQTFHKQGLPSFSSTFTPDIYLLNGSKYQYKSKRGSYQHGSRIRRLSAVAEFFSQFSSLGRLFWQVEIFVLFTLDFTKNHFALSELPSTFNFFNLKKIVKNTFPSLNFGKFKNGPLLLP